MLELNDAPKPKSDFDLLSTLNISKSPPVSNTLLPTITSPLLNILEDENISTQVLSLSEILNIIQHIGHLMMKMSHGMSTVQKDIGILKIDVIKNQELLSNLIDKSRQSNNPATDIIFDRSSLKLPLMTFDELNALEASDDQKKILAHILRRNGRSFDPKRTIYQIMKMILDNRVAEGINMEGRRGEKIAFGHFDFCKIIIEIVKDIFVDESIISIKNHISDWLKQAPKRK